MPPIGKTYAQIQQWAIQVMTSETPTTFVAVLGIGPLGPKDN
jgi:hypothetical protein